MKRAVTLLILICLCLTLGACASSNEFIHAELTITVPDGFQQQDAGGRADMLLTNGEATVALTRFSFSNSSVPPALSTDDFAEYYMHKTEVEATLYNYRDIPYYTYRDGGTGLFCTAVFYRTPYAYFTVLFAARDEAEWRERFLEIADTATLKWNEDNK